MLTQGSWRYWAFKEYMFCFPNREVFQFCKGSWWSGVNCDKGWQKKIFKRVKTTYQSPQLWYAGPLLDKWQKLSVDKGLYPSRGEELELQLMIPSKYWFLCQKEKYENNREVKLLHHFRKTPCISCVVLLSAASKRNCGLWKRCMGSKKWWLKVWNVFQKRSSRLCLLLPGGEKMRKISVKEVGKILSGIHMKKG